MFEVSYVTQNEPPLFSKPYSYKPLNTLLTTRQHGHRRSYQPPQKLPNTLNENP
jgi:hypothetical protein